MIVSVLLSFVKNSIGNDDLALRKRLIRQVFFLLTTLIHVDLVWCLARFRDLYMSWGGLHRDLVYARS